MVPLDAADNTVETPEHSLPAETGHCQLQTRLVRKGQLKNCKRCGLPGARNMPGPGKQLVEGRETRGSFWMFLKSHHARFKHRLDSDIQENQLLDTKVAQAVTHSSPVTF